MGKLARRIFRVRVTREIHAGCVGWNRSDTSNKDSLSQMGKRNPTLEDLYEKRNLKPQHYVFHSQTIYSLSKDSIR